MMTHEPTTPNNDQPKGSENGSAIPDYDFSSIAPDEVAAEFDRAQKAGLFTICTASQWLQSASGKPIPKMLFSELWHEGEVCILYADTNLGKSILAVQIAQSIASGTPIPGFKLEAAAQPVLYFDFELSEKQFEARYSEGYQNPFAFSSDLFRAEINPDADLPEGESFEDALNKALEKAILAKGAKVLIIDNLTYLRNETEKAKDALPLMKQLKALKAKHGLSILALAHTPKRDLSKPVTRNDLQGSKMLINFCDSAFAIGESHSDKAIRYLKQIKERNTEKVFDGENVCLCQVAKTGNFLGFEFIGFGAERDHLKEISEKDRSSVIEKAKVLSSEGKSQRAIAHELGISVGAVNKYLKL